LHIIFTALHEMQSSSHENSVCSSVKRIDCDKMDEKSVQISHCTKDHLA